MKKLILLKLVSLLLVGTAHAQMDKVAKFATAIARTEGFYVKGSLPNRLANPGDIRSKKRHAYPGQIGLYHGYVVFKNAAWGWAALERQIWLIVNGDSKKYTQDMTMLQIAKVYAASPQWPKTLCKILRISPTLTFEEYFELAPRVSFTEVRYDILRTPTRTPMPELFAVSGL